MTTDGSDKLFIADTNGNAIRIYNTESGEVSTFAGNGTCGYADGIGTNTRVRWTFSPLGELFVVYNHTLRELRPTPGIQREWRFDSNQVLVKLQYAWRY